MHHVTPSLTADETRLAADSAERLSRLAGRRLRHPLTLTIASSGGGLHETMSIPASAIAVLSEVLGELARGAPLALIPVHAELTTQQAAEVLQVSRPFVVQLLDAGILPVRMVGTHRRVRLEDVLRYKQLIDEERLRTLGELTAEAQELGLGY